VSWYFVLSTHVDADGADSLMLMQMFLDGFSFLCCFSVLAFLCIPRFYVSKDCWRWQASTVFVLSLGRYKRRENNRKKIQVKDEYTFSKLFSM